MTIICGLDLSVNATEPSADAPIPRFERILIPTDFTEIANSAIAVGYGMVSSGGTVYLLHVRNPHSARTEEDIVRQMRSLIPQEAIGRRIRTEIELVNSNDRTTVISLVADRLRVGAICMGTHARSGVVKMVMGSQAEDVLVQARCPVIMVPPQYPLS